MSGGRTALLCELETALWTTDTRSNREWMDAHLSPTFTEFGRSGRRYTRDEVLDLPVGDIDAVLPLPDLTVRTLDHNTQLVTYRSVVGPDEANRASIWVRNDGRWQLEFHQGTPTW